MVVIIRVPSKPKNSPAIDAKNTLSQFVIIFFKAPQTAGQKSPPQIAMTI